MKRYANIIGDFEAVSSRRGLKGVSTRIEVPTERRRMGVAHVIGDQNEAIALPNGHVSG
jgi:hypothetical protein